MRRRGRGRPQQPQRQTQRAWLGSEKRRWAEGTRTTIPDILHRVLFGIGVSACLLRKHCGFPTSGSRRTKKCRVSVLTGGAQGRGMHTSRGFGQRNAAGGTKACRSVATALWLGPTDVAHGTNGGPGPHHRTLKSGAHNRLRRVTSAQSTDDELRWGSRRLPDYLRGWGMGGGGAGNITGGPCTVAAKLPTSHVRCRWEHL